MKTTEKVAPEAPRQAPKKSTNRIFPRRYLTVKMLRDLSRHKAQFLSIVLMAFVAVFVYAGVGGEWRGLRRSVDNFYAETRLADASFLGGPFTNEQIQAVAALEGITAAERRTLIPAAVKHFSQQEPTGTPELTLHFVESNTISSTYVITGTAPDMNDEQGIWLAERFATANKLAIGDTIGLNIAGIDCDKIIRGTIYAPEYVYMEGEGSLTPDFGTVGYAYLSHKAFPLPEAFAYSALLVTAEIPNPEIEERVGEVLRGSYTVYLHRSDYPSVALYDNEIAQHKMMGDIFPVVFLLVALLTMLTTMTRIVRNQRIQIGTLKAMGYRRKTILRHYISYGMFPALLGAIPGSIVGPLTLPHLFYPSMSAFYTIPEWKSVYHTGFAVVAVGVVALCTLVTYFACAGQLKDNPASTLRPAAPKVSKHNLLERTALWRRAGFNARWNLRDALRNRARSTMAIVGVMGCTTLLVCAFGMNDCMAALKTWQYEDLYHFETKLVIDANAAPDRIETIRDEVRGELLMEGAVEVRSAHAKRNAALSVTDANTLLHYTDASRRPIELPSDGVSMSKKLADILGVSVGDSVEWSVMGTVHRVSTPIAALYRDPSAQGLTMPRAVLEDLGFAFEPTSILTAASVTERIDGIVAVSSTSEMIRGWDDLTEAMMTMVYILILGAVILSVVVLYNLGLLSFSEMERDMATLKVMGMRTRKLRNLLLTQNLWFSAIGYVLGIPAGLWLIRVITDSSGETFDFPVELTVSTALLAFSISFGLSVLVNLLFSRKIRRLNMVESLKAME